MKNVIPKRDHPTPKQVRDARNRAGLTQREASLMIFGADSFRTFQNWETGTRKAPKSTFILFLLMTHQITVEEARAALTLEGKK